MEDKSTYDDLFNIYTLLITENEKLREKESSIYDQIKLLEDVRLLRKECSELKKRYSTISGEMAFQLANELYAIESEFKKDSLKKSNEKLDQLRKVKKIHTNVAKNVRENETKLSGLEKKIRNIEKAIAISKKSDPRGILDILIEKK